MIDCPESVLLIRTKRARSNGGDSSSQVCVLSDLQGLSHGMHTTNNESIDADLLAFIQG
jgi:hypothetical protein